MLVQFWKDMFSAVDDSSCITIHWAKEKEFEGVLVNGELFAKEREFSK